jgi:TPR repeat protein
MTRTNRAAGRANQSPSRWIACLMMAIAVLTFGCAREALRPVPYENANVETWFSSTTVKLSDPDRLNFEEAMAAYDAGRYEEAIRTFRELAGSGVGEAAYALGVAHLRGAGVPKNPAVAAQWMIAAVSKSHSRWPHASYYLGTMFLDGEGVPQNGARQAPARSVAQRKAMCAPACRSRACMRPARAPAGSRAGAKLAQASADAGDVESHLWLLRGYQPADWWREPARGGRCPRRSPSLLEQKIRIERDPRAMRDMAFLFDEGLGRPKDSAAALYWLNEAAEAGHPEFLVDYGEDILKGTDGHEADPRRGFRILEPAATRFRHAEAMELVAEAYRDGHGTAPDPKQAEAWYKRAIEAGSIKADLEYGRMLIARKDDPAAFRQGIALLERAAKHEMPQAWAKLGELHVDQAFPQAVPSTESPIPSARTAALPAATGEAGPGLSGRTRRAADLAQAEKLLNQAAKQTAGAVLALGQGYPPAPSCRAAPTRRSAGWRRRPTAGIPAPCSCSGAPISTARRCRRTRRKPTALHAAAGLGHSGAMFVLGRTSLAGGDDSKPLEGMVWLHQALEQGNMDAAQTLGSAYLWGKHGLNRDPKRGLQLLESSAAAGNVGAQRELGYVLVNPQGSGLEPNPERGMGLLQQAADKSDAYAMQLLGNVYLEGAKGVKPDAGKAELWLGRAAETGDTTAMTILGSVMSTAPDAPQFRQGPVDGSGSQNDDTAHQAGQPHLRRGRRAAAAGQHEKSSRPRQRHAGAKATPRAYHERGRRAARRRRAAAQAARAGHPTRVVLPRRSDRRPGNREPQLRAGPAADGGRR